MSFQSPIKPFLEKQGIVLLDGGLATELEAQGHNLSTHLWSAELLKTNPGAICDVHHAYLEAGADCITSASYQASFDGFIAAGLTMKEAKSLLIQSVDLANEARDRYIKHMSPTETNRIRPLVAASIGPYGAFLADGGEYRGNYGVSNDRLTAFHESRWHVLSESRIDLLACETIPSYQEAEILHELMVQTPDIAVWVSFSCKDGEHISDGTPIKECAAIFKNCHQVVAIGVNCTAPKYVLSLIKHIQAGVPQKPIAVYPNSGEIYDVENKIWLGTTDPQNCSSAALQWFNAGARLIGGCCRVRPAHIKAMKESFQTI